jgi:hypothetical protein
MQVIIDLETIIHLIHLSNIVEDGTVQIIEIYGDEKPE